MSNCKDKIYEIFNKVHGEFGDKDVNNYQTLKKELVKMLKEWDKMYLNHVKKTYPEMNGLHMTCMKPLTQLIDSNVNFWRLEEMIKNKESVPEFRYKALEHEFCKFFTGVCEVLKEHGELKNHFNIVQMMNTIKIDNWRNIRPFEYYLTPLDKSITTVR